MRLLRITIALLCILVLMSSCLTLEEHYTFNKDGSGKMEYVVKLSNFFAFVQDEESGEDLTDRLEIEEKIGSISNLPGIRQIEKISEDEGRRVGLSFEFSNIASLNLALDSLLNEGPDDGFAYFKADKKVFKRQTPAQPGDSKPFMIGNDKIGDFDLNTLFRAVRYKQIYTFPRPVQVVYTRATVELEKNTVSVRTNLKKVIDDPSEREVTMVVK